MYNFKHSIRKPPSFVKNSLQVLNKLSRLIIPDDYILVSFDVKSLFTNTSLEIVVESIQRRYNTIRNFPNAPLDELIKGFWKSYGKSGFPTFCRHGYD